MSSPSPWPEKFRKRGKEGKIYQNEAVIVALGLGTMPERRGKLYPNLKENRAERFAKDFGALMTLRDADKNR